MFENFNIIFRTNIINQCWTCQGKKSIRWGRVNRKLLLLVGRRYNIGFKKFQAKNLYYFNKLRKRWTLIASSCFEKNGKFFDIKILKKKNRKKMKKKKKRALIMMTLILPMSWNLETLVKENGPTSLKGKLIDKLVLGVVRIVKHVWPRGLTSKIM